VPKDWSRDFTYSPLAHDSLTRLMMASRQIFCLCHLNPAIKRMRMNFQLINETISQQHLTAQAVSYSAAKRSRRTATDWPELSRKADQYTGKYLSIRHRFDVPYLTARIAYSSAAVTIVRQPRGSQFILHADEVRQNRIKCRSAEWIAMPAFFCNWYQFGNIMHIKFFIRLVGVSYCL